MRQGNNGRRPRGGRPNRRPGPLKAQTFDSNGPDVRIRGNAHQVYEKYLTLARDSWVAGDRVLTEVAARLRSGVRTDDIVGRIGGDEFVAICENAEGGAASSIAERVRSVIREPIAGLSRPVSITASIGVVTYVPGVDARPSSDGLLNRADTAMYRSKGTGKDRVSVEP